MEYITEALVRSGPLSTANKNDANIIIYSFTYREYTRHGLPETCFQR